MMPARRVVVMGVCGCGKTAVGRALADRLGLPFIDGDDLHPATNIARMSAGIPLTDEDRADWLDAIADRLSAAGASGEGLVVSCSALKRRYRDRLRRSAPDMRLVHLHGDRPLLQARMAARTDHYMPPSLLDSQLQTLEMPQDGEAALTLDIASPVDVLVAEAWARLSSD